MQMVIYIASFDDVEEFSIAYSQHRIHTLYINCKLCTVNYEFCVMFCLPMSPSIFQEVDGGGGGSKQVYVVEI